jgi:acid phosphatase type 7
MNETLRLQVRISGAALLLGAAALGVVSCQNTGASGGTGASSGAGGHAGTTTGGTAGAGAGGAAPAEFTPQGCAFTIAPRPEYTGFMPATSTVGATPNIRRVRLGLGGNVTGTTGRADPATSIAMAWQTDEGTFASEVEWGAGTDPTAWPTANHASGVTWDTPQGALNGNGPERMHEVYVCGLAPATTYGYRVGGGPAGSEVWSDVYTFTTTPAAGPTKVTFAIAGDSRGEQNNAWQILQRRIHTLSPTLQLFSGDMINLAPDQKEWEEWLSKAWQDTDLTYLTLGTLLTLDAHGNHDNHTALFYGNLTLPQDNKHYQAYDELFYSMDVGPVHVIMMDDFWVADPSGDSNYQPTLQSWLTADLAAANQNRAKVPWIITMHHEPEYSSSDHGKDPDVLLVRQFFAPIWQQYHVDVAFSGHDHDYERSFPLDIGADLANPTQTTDAQGTTFVVCAGSGADAYPSGTSTWTAQSQDFTSGGALGFYSILTVDATSLKLEAHEIEADASDPIFDTYTITK